MQPERSLTKRTTAIQLPGCTLERTALRVNQNISFDKWMVIGDSLREIEGAVQWWIGDWLNFGERKYGELYAQALEAGASPQTFMNYAWAASRIEPSLRKEVLGFHHHLAVASLEPDEQGRILDAAVENEWTVVQTRAAVQSYKRLKNSPLIDLGDGCRTVSDLQELIDEGELFSVVYADPPWRYGNQGTRAATDNHYGTMTVDEICALPVTQVADKNAHLHLWTTNAFLFEAKRVMEAWGFEYKSCFVWCKNQMGIGNYWRVSHEFLLFGLRGSLPFQDRGQMSWAAIDRTEHSEKPDEIRQRVERVSPGPYLEMFGRVTRPGWTIFGNEIFNRAEPRKMQDVEGPLFTGM